MTNRLDQTFRALRRLDRKALIGFVTAGFPTKAAFEGQLTQLERAGLDIIEIGVPFSDPVGDGPTIQRSSQKALGNGVTLGWVLHAISSLRSRIMAPLVLMSYANPLTTMGLDSFFGQASRAGVDGVIIPDLIPEEGSAFERAAAKSGIAIIYLAAPTTTPERLRRIVRATSGFVYAVSLTGVTGARTGLANDLPGFLSRIRRISAKPIAVGFGISTPSQVALIRKHVDGVIVGSALISRLEKSTQRAERFVRSLQRTLNPNGLKEPLHAS